MSHRTLEETTPGASRTASVLADIGGDVGAAILYVPARLAGLEIEIRPMGADWDGTHTGVRERHVNGTVVWAAFFGSLAAGRYELRVREHPSRSTELDVVGGEVAQARW